MPVPDFQSLMLPVLREFAPGVDTALSAVRERVVTTEGLSANDTQETFPKSNRRIFAHHVGRAVSHLMHAGLIERVRRDVYRLTQEGEYLLSRNPPRIDTDMLQDYPEYLEWVKKKRLTSPDVEAAPGLSGDSQETPEEALDHAAQRLRSVLEAEVLERIRNAASMFLERVVVDLLIALGYGGGDATMGRVTGRSGDGGIDGTIREDALGLDEIYVQAKKYAKGKTVGESDLRNFAGAIDAAGMTKGVFVTTAGFTRAAKDYVARSPKRIVLIDGAELARLMVLHDVGVRRRDFYEVKRIDEDYFDQEVT